MSKWRVTWAIPLHDDVMGDASSSSDAPIIFFDRNFISLSLSLSLYIYIYIFLILCSYILIACFLLCSKLHLWLNFLVLVKLSGGRVHIVNIIGKC